jgi:hypothetical protein
LPGPEDFYDIPGPPFLQQGDVLKNVPLIGLPAENRLILLRDSQGLERWTPRPGVVQAVDETVVSNAFSRDNLEYVAAFAQRGTAMLITQTCNLTRTDLENWMIAPVYTIEGNRPDQGNLFAGKYENYFGLRPHPAGLFPTSFAVLGDLKPIPRDSVTVVDRVAALQPIRQKLLGDQIAKALARDWGFAANDIVPRTGRYRCLRCNRWYDVRNEIKDLVEGGRFPECEKCAEIGKSAQWYLLLRHQPY